MSTSIPSLNSCILSKSGWAIRISRAVLWVILVLIFSRDGWRQSSRASFKSGGGDGSKGTPFPPSPRGTRLLLPQRFNFTRTGLGLFPLDTVGKGPDWPSERAWFCTSRFTSDPPPVPSQLTCIQVPIITSIAALHTHLALSFSGSNKEKFSRSLQWVSAPLLQFPI